MVVPVKIPAQLALLTAVAASLIPSHADWPQWRGPERTAVVKDPAHPFNKINADPKILWQIEVGPGQSSPLIVGDNAIYMDGIDGQETIHVLDLKTGKQRWKAEVGPMVEFQNAYGEGPRSTPLVDGDRVYAQSCGGEFKCYSLKDGKQLWAISFEKDFGAKWFGNKSPDPGSKETAARRHGNNGSAVIDGDLIFIPVGSPENGTLIAFDKVKGQKKWAAGSDNTAYSSVVVGTLAGVRQAVHLTGDAMMGVDVKTGKILWREIVKTGAKRNVATPVIDGDTVTIASTNIGTIRYLISGNAPEQTITKAWENKDIKTVIGTPTQSDNLIFTIGPGSKCDLVCLNAADGAERWKAPGMGDYASISVINDKVFALNSNGELLVAQADGSAFKEVARLQLCAKTWASPAYDNGRFLVKDGSKLTLLTLD